MSSFIRHRQRAVTAVSPHQGNRKVLVPKRIKGYRELSWSTIPGQSFEEGVPASVDFRAWLSGTNRSTAQIIEGDTFPAGFSFANGVLSWDGTGSVPNTVENQMTASDGEGPNAESNLFNIQTTEAPPVDVSLVSAQWTINNKNGTLDSRDPDYAGALNGDLSVAASYSVDDNGSRSLAVTRQNGTEGIVGCSWQITGPNAADFTPNSDTLSFADGVSSADIDVDIADLGADGSATVTLSAPTGGATIDNAAAPITINDNTYSFSAETGFSITGGIIGEDQTIQITDAQSRFGTKPSGGPPMYIWDAEYGDTGFSSLGRNTSTSYPPLATYQTGTKPLSTGGALQYNFVTGSAQYNLFGRMNFPGGTKKTFLGLRMRSNFNGADAHALDSGYNMKGPRITIPGSTFEYYSQPGYGQSDATSGNPRWYGFGGTSRYEGGPVFGWQRIKDTWRTWDSYASTEPGQGRCEIQCGGTSFDYGGSVATGLNQSFISIWQAESPNYSTSYRFWSGYIYLDDSFCVAHLSDEANWNTSTDNERAICIPVSWSAGTIQLRLRKRTFADLSGLYLYVTTNAGTVLKIGQFT